MIDHRTFRLGIIVINADEQDGGKRRLMPSARPRNALGFVCHVGYRLQGSTSHRTYQLTHHFSNRIEAGLPEHFRCHIDADGGENLLWRL